MDLRRRVLWLPLLVFAFVLFLRCGGGAESSSEWTVEEGALTLEEDRMVSETDSFYLGRIADVTAASDGRMHVADWDATHVKVFTPDGGLVETIGGEGEGPGEFDDLNAVLLSRGDSLYVFDRGGRSASAFAPDGAFVRRVGIDVPDGIPSEIYVPQTVPGFLVEHSSVFVSDDEEAEYVVRHVDPTGAVLDTLIQTAAEPSHLASRGQARMSIPIPYAPAPQTVLGPDDIVHFARSDSLTVVRLGIDGVPRDTVAVPFEPLPVTEEDRERVLADYSERRPMPANKVPATKPAFDDLLVDDQGRYWFGRPTAHPDTTAWWVADPDAKRVATAKLSSGIDLRRVRSGFAYAITDTEEGAPAVVRYDVSIEQ